tara:strand:+ start:199 stop:615 length:417 start_codon:yes stop_codon:yes gene_type:complete
MTKYYIETDTPYFPFLVSFNKKTHRGSNWGHKWLLVKWKSAESNIANPSRGTLLKSWSSVTIYFDYINPEERELIDRYIFPIIGEVEKKRIGDLKSVRFLNKYPFDIEINGDNNKANPLVIRRMFLKYGSGNNYIGMR